MVDSINKAGVRKLTALGLLVTMGIVFGDIGTSPLYVMKAIVGVNANYDADYIIGVISCVIWTLTLQTTLKYVVIALRADNNGEGGILALYALLRNLRHKWFYVVAAIGASALIADGVITPAVTVTSAIEGLGMLSPEVPVIPIVLVIILGIFLMQQAGTGAIGKWFGPFMLVWFLMLGVLGCSMLHLHPGVLKAFNPWYAIKTLIDYPGWFLILGAVFLCTTGAEALYSDLGHCGRKNITVSWIFVKIMLILNYLGQGAWLIALGPEKTAGINPFYGIMPHWFTLAGVIMSTGAAIIASQALLSGSFTIFSEAINLDLWLRMRIKYPSIEKGQLYIPAINWFLLAGCIITVLIFRDSSHMEAAYGLAITITMLMTTILLTFYLRHKGVSRALCALFMAAFITLEGVFFIANMVKFTHGGWYTLLIGGLVCAVMLIWHNATRIRDSYIEYQPFEKYAGVITDIKNDEEIPGYASNIIFFSRSPKKDMIESKLIYSIINKSPKRASHYWFIHINHDDSPEALEYSVDVLVPDTVFFVTMTIGFRVQPQVSVFLRQIIEDMVSDNELDLRSQYSALRKRNIAGDFKFIILHRIFSASSSCRKLHGSVMRMHEWLRRFEISDQNAMGLDTSVVMVETVPLILNTAPRRRIVRKGKIHHD